MLYNFVTQYKDNLPHYRVPYRYGLERLECISVRTYMENVTSVNIPYEHCTQVIGIGPVAKWNPSLGRIGGPLRPELTIHHLLHQRYSPHFSSFHLT